MKLSEVNPKVIEDGYGPGSFSVDIEYPMELWTQWLVWLSVRDRLPMWFRRRCFRLNLWLLNRGWA